MLQNEEKNAILDRAKAAIGAESEKGLADRLGISPQVLAGWRTRNQIDFVKLKEGLTPEQFIFAMYDEKVILSERMGLPDFLTRAEYLAGLIAVNERVDRLTALLAARLGTSEAPQAETPEEEGD